MLFEVSRIIRTERQSISLEILPDASLLVRAPEFVSDNLIKNFINVKKDWIIRKKKAVELHRSRTTEKKYVDGDRFYYLGNEYSLRIVKDAGHDLVLKDEFLLSERKQAKARDLFAAWYKGQVKDIITDRVEIYAEKFGFSFNKVKVNSAVKRWGSCSSNGNLNFSWRLVMAPLDVIDYVVIHELVHLKIKNHSSSFWQMVATYCPDYKISKKWLNDKGRFLYL
ncbi:MAG: M48 family metallopeptidase [bacterium]|nr:M48 family metallopeptidase [bacterium]